MNIASITSHSQVVIPTIVTVEGITEFDSVETIRTLAVHAAGETGRHFGAHVALFDGGIAQVTINKD